MIEITKQNNKDVKECKDAPRDGIENDFKKEIEPPLVLKVLKGLNLINSLFDENKLELCIVDERIPMYKLENLKHGNANISHYPEKSYDGNFRKLGDFEHIKSDLPDFKISDMYSDWHNVRLCLETYPNRNQFFDAFDELMIMNGKLIDAITNSERIMRDIQNINGKAESVAPMFYTTEGIYFKDSQSDASRLYNDMLESKDEMVTLFKRMHELIVPVYNYIYDVIINNAYNDIEPSERAINVYSNVVNAYIILLEATLQITYVDAYYVVKYQESKCKNPVGTKPHVVCEYYNIHRECIKFSTIAQLYINL